LKCVWPPVLGFVSHKGTELHEWLRNVEERRGEEMRRGRRGRRGRRVEHGEGEEGEGGKRVRNGRRKRWWEKKRIKETTSLPTHTHIYTHTHTHTHKHTLVDAFKCSSASQKSFMRVIKSAGNAPSGEQMDCKNCNMIIFFSSYTEAR
jgi:GrpB-like predicted nucleotidyltransferase (UPF0157 family)